MTLRELDEERIQNAKEPEDGAFCIPSKKACHTTLRDLEGLENGFAKASPTVVYDGENAWGGTTTIVWCKKRGFQVAIEVCKYSPAYFKPSPICRKCLGLKKGQWWPRDFLDARKVKVSDEYMQIINSPAFLVGLRKTAKEEDIDQGQQESGEEIGQEPEFERLPTKN
jgi:hypothetical protein